MSRRDCALRLAACCGVAFLALSASVDKLVQYMFGPGWIWIVGGTYIAGVWGYQSYCKEEPQ